MNGTGLTVGRGAISRPSTRWEGEMALFLSTVTNKVDKKGRVESPRVQQSSDSIFERAALAAVRQWRFEPGRRKGEPVRSRKRVTITFPKG